MTEPTRYPRYPPIRTPILPDENGKELLELRRRAQIVEEKKELDKRRKNWRFFYRQHPYYLSEAERLA
jgi:hypothetical protein